MENTHNKYYYKFILEYTKYLLIPTATAMAVAWSALLFISPLYESSIVIELNETTLLKTKSNQLIEQVFEEEVKNKDTEAKNRLLLMYEKNITTQYDPRLKIATLRLRADTSENAINKIKKLAALLIDEDRRQEVKVSEQIIKANEEWIKDINNMKLIGHPELMASIIKIKNENIKMKNYIESKPENLIKIEPNKNLGKVWPRTNLIILIVMLITGPIFYYINRKKLKI